MPDLSPRFTGKVDAEGKRIKAHDPHALAQRLQELAGQDVQYFIDPLEDERSVQANAYLWGVVYQRMSEATGQPALDIHEAMKQRFLAHKAVRLVSAETGEIEEYDVVGSTRTSKSKFYDFVEQVRAFAGDWLGLVIPDPDVNWREKKRRRAA